MYLCLVWLYIDVWLFLFTFSLSGAKNWDSYPHDLSTGNVCVLLSLFCCCKQCTNPLHSAIGGENSSDRLEATLMTLFFCAFGFLSSDMSPWVFWKIYFSLWADSLSLPQTGSKLTKNNLDYFSHLQNSCLILAISSSLEKQRPESVIFFFWLRLITNKPQDAFVRPAFFVIV